MDFALCKKIAGIFYLIVEWLPVWTESDTADNSDEDDWEKKLRTPS